MGLNFAKKFAMEKLTKQIINYIGRDPEANFMKLLDIADKMAVKDSHHHEIANLRKGFKNDPVIKEYVKRFFVGLAPGYQEKFMINFFVNSGILGIPYQFKQAEKLGVSVPWTILIDPTSACNLNCDGCWAGKYNKSDSLKFETIDRIIEEAKELGIYFIIFSGGEPTVYPRLFDIFEKHDDVGFMMYTNGTLIDDEFIEKMLEVGNISPAISLEGFEEETDRRRGKGVFKHIMRTMEKMRDRGIFFGASITCTRENVDELYDTDEFVDLLLEKGVKYAWNFHYIPIGRDPNLDLMITPEQREFLAKRVPEIRSKKPLFLADFWNDGTFSGGCVAGGRRYFHITPKGDVEPCAFVHFATDNIKGKSLKTVLKNPLFKAYQKRMPFNRNLMSPCPVIDNPAVLREMVKESGAYPTHEGADNIVKEEVANYLDHLSREWEDLSQDIYNQRMDSLEVVEGSDNEKYMISPFNDTFTKRYFKQLQK